ncbi:acyl-CoA synthetases/AMP-acid ligases II [Setomelanomma holmii]|uniref:Acyl-CoA synthetases/AMP-acid ligases II n=1 Tax=Setomelanomma holmii TaxID=210430 RepID=A0A9P4LGL7_9PLEO|nr:acyl-CoA synthetases/AMP-acid ligases II [Setomelanomma holmii]
MTRQRIYQSTYPAPYCPTNLSISQYLTQYNPDAVSKDKIILEDNWTGHDLTYASLREQAARHAWSLSRKYNLGVGDVVAISAPNSVAHVQLIHAVLWTCATVAPMNFLSTTDDFIHFLNVCEPKLVAIDPSLHESIKKALAQLSSSRPISVLSILGSDSCVPNVRRLLPNHICRCSLCVLPIFDLSTSDNREQTAAICFSSGTSGKPKGVELSHHNLISSLAGIRSSDPAFYNSQGRCVFFAPLCHIYGLNTVGLMGIWLGSYTMLMKKYSLDNLLRLSSRCRANILQIVPPITLALTKVPTLDIYNLSEIRYIMCSGAALQPEVIQILQKRFNQAPIFQGYGMTETNIATLRSHEWNRTGSVGRLFANVEARLVDDHGDDVDEGQDGEMLVRGPTVFRCVRSLNDPAATRQGFHNGWMRTGDVLHFDPDGFLYLTDRKKELIKYKGFQVAPSELEGILNTHPLVDDGVVCAKWDEQEGNEAPMAYVTLTSLALKHPRKQVEVINNIAQFVNGNVSSYKKLRCGIKVLPEILKTASGKILRRLLPARLVAARPANL